MYSGLAAYSSGVKHQGKMPWMIISVTLPRPLAIVCQPSTTALRNGSLLVQPLCRDNDLNSLRILGAKPQSGGRAERQATDMSPLDPDGLHECSDVIGE